MVQLLWLLLSAGLLVAAQPLSRLNPPIPSPPIEATTLHLGVVLPLSGAQARRGAAQLTALRASARVLQRSGVPITLNVQDSQGEPAAVRARAAALVAGGVHALVCCQTSAEVELVAELASELPILALAPAAAGGGGVFTLVADERAELTRLQLEPSLRPLALMAPVGSLGDAAEGAVGAQAGVARYPLEANREPAPLTPEALWVITREPGSVIVWDEREGTLRAARALAARGYGGPLVVRRALWDTLSATERALLGGARSALSPAVLGYTLPDAHPSKQPVARLRRALLTVPASSLDARTLEGAASAWDATLLFGHAAEQLLVYGPEPSRTEAARAALRDALLGLGPVVGAGGSYDFVAGDAYGPLPASLIIAEWRSGRFRPLP